MDQDLMYRRKQRDLEDFSFSKFKLVDKYRSIVKKYSKPLSNKTPLSNKLIAILEAAETIGRHLQIVYQQKDTPKGKDAIETASFVLKMTLDFFQESNTPSESGEGLVEKLIGEVAEQGYNVTWKDKRDTLKMRDQKGKTAMTSSDDQEDEYEKFRRTVDEMTFPKQLHTYKEQVAETEKDPEIRKYKMAYLTYRKEYITFVLKVNEMTDPAELEQLLTETRDPNKQKHIEGHLAHLEQPKEQDLVTREQDTRSSLGKMLIDVSMEAK